MLDQRPQHADFDRTETSATGENERCSHRFPPAREGARTPDGSNLSREARGMMATIELTP
jgi:hypothetical protein